MSNALRTRTPQDTAGTQESRAKALQSAITAIEKAFGKDAIMRLGDNHSMVVERIPTGSLGLDIALGGPYRFSLSETWGASVNGQRKKMLGWLRKTRSSSQKYTTAMGFHELQKEFNFEY